MWCHKAEIATVAGPDGPLLSRLIPNPPAGGTGPVLSVQSSGPYFFAKPEKDEIGPRKYKGCGPKA